MSNKGKLCTIHCAISTPDGTLMDDTRRRNQPLQFVCEEGGMVPGVVAAVESMRVGETNNFKLDPVDAFGEYQEEFVEVVPIDQVPNKEKLVVDQYIYLQDGDEYYPTKVVSIEDGMVKLDANHPLAGKMLNFFIKLVAVEEYKPEAE